MDINSNIYKKTAEGVVISSVAANFQLILQFVTIVLLTRYLTVRDYGIYSFVFTTITLLGFVSSISLFAIARFVPGYIASRNFFLAKRLVRFSLAYAFIVSLAVAAVFFFFPDAFNSISRDKAFSPPLLHVFSWIILFFYLSEVLDITLTAQIEVRYRVFFRFLYTLLSLILTALSLHFSLGLKGVLWAQATALAALFLSSFLKVKASLLDLPDDGDRQFEKKPILRYCFFAQLGLIGDLFTSLTIDIYLISYWLGSQAVGEYTFGIKIPQTIITNSPSVLGAAVVFPYIIRIYTQTKNKETLSLFFSFYTRFTGFLAIPLLCGMVLLAEPAIRLIFNPEYINSLDIYILASWYFTIFSFRFAMVPIYNTIKKPEFGFYSKLIFLLSTVVNIYLLNKGFGVTAVIKVGIASISAVYLMEFLLTRSQVPLQIPWKSLGKSLLCGLAMNLLLGAFLPFVRGIASMAALSVFGMAFYFLLCYKIRPFVTEDKEIMEKAGRVGILLRHFRREDNEKH